MPAQAELPAGGITTYMRDEMIAYCGLACHKCGAFLATINNDNEKRKEVAAAWSKLYNFVIKPEEVNCRGCLSHNTLFMHCQVCAIRKCGQEKGVKNCAHCPDYGCAKLESILSLAPDARKNLEEIRSSF
jgi:hypothetical protein